MKRKARSLGAVAGSASGIKNRTLFHGDNLEMLRGIDSETIHLIATDPPFNKGRDFHATPDSLASGASFQDRWSWEDDVHQEWVDQLEDDWPDVLHVIEGSRKSYGDDMGAFLCFMGVRLLEMRRVLRDDGSMYLHCDPTASHYLKELMDAVFGRKNFRNEIVWCYTGPSNTKRDFPRKHDIILRYSKTATFYFSSNEIKIPYSQNFLDRRRYVEGKSGIFGPNELHNEEKKQKSNYKSGKIPEDWWSDIPSGGQISRNERVGYPTQKPLALYERIIQSSSNEGDLILDPFCGCATTLIASEKLKRQWIGIDIWEKAHQIVMERLKKECHLAAPDDSRLDLIIPEGTITYSDSPPMRTDHGDMAVPSLKTIQGVHEPPGPKMTRAQMYEYLLKRKGSACQGCNRRFDDPRYLELDHNTPRSDGGLNHISNRILLCSPCNRLKSNTRTLSGLRQENKKQGYMLGSKDKQFMESRKIPSLEDYVD